MMFRCICKVLGVDEDPTAAFFYPQSKLVMCRNRLWRARFGLLGTHVLSGLLGWHNVGDPVDFVVMDYRRTRGKREFYLHLFTKSGGGNSYHMLSVWGVGRVVRIQRWVRKIWWRRKAVVVMLGVGMGAGFGVLRGLNGDMARKCLEMGQ